MSIIVFSVEKFSAFWMNWVSVLVMYLPMRVLAAFSQWVSSEAFGLLGSANAVSRVVYLTGFTSTSEGSRESFLLHFGQYPLYCWRISSGGLRSSPSYKMWLHPWHLTRWGIDGSFWFVLEDLGLWCIYWLLSLLGLVFFVLCGCGVFRGHYRVVCFWGCVFVWVCCLSEFWM